MSRTCDLSAIRPQSGNNVSHANNKTRRRFLPNLRPVRLRSDALGEDFKFTVALATLRTIEHRGGLDAHLLRERAGNLSARAQEIRQRILSQRAKGQGASSAAQ